MVHLPSPLPSRAREQVGKRLPEQRPPEQRLLQERQRSGLVLVAAGGIAVGLVAAALGASDVARAAWALTTLIVLAPAAVETLRRLVAKDLGVDLVAVLAMAASLALGEFLAGAVVALMLSGGTALEAWAQARARRALSALLAHAPNTAHRRDGEAVEDVPVDAVAVGDRLVVRTGEVVPVDGVLGTDAAVLDVAALTGESRPIDVTIGARVASGSTNAGPPFELRATARAEASTYAGIVRLVRGALAQRAPLIRLADRYAGGFVAVTLLLAGGAWAAAGDPVRALAVLVVATPCPLIIAAPAAIVAGLSRAAREGIIVKGGGTLETLARARIVVLDKTGTLTTGNPRLVEIQPFDDARPDDILHFAASLEQLSAHPVAPAVVAAARARGLTPSFPRDVHEQPGAGLRGNVGAASVAIGQLAWLTPNPPPAARALMRRAASTGATALFVARDGTLLGALLLQDALRAEAPRAIAALRRLGVRRIVLATGDHPDIAELVADAVGVDEVLAERTPAEKVAALESLAGTDPVVMVGDGVNDAPVLARADVGIAMGARGATAASEAADVVLTADRLEGVVAVFRIAQRTRAIALQSIVVGMGLSGIAMLVAAAGGLAPVTGAILQEGIDVAVILNALRALGGGGGPRVAPAQRQVAQHLLREHTSLRPRIEELSLLAARLDTLSPAAARAELARASEFLAAELLPHELEEQAAVYPAVALLDPGQDPTGPLVRTHQVIARLVHLFGRLVNDLPAPGPGPEDVPDLRRALHGLHAILLLHLDQEDELYGALAGPPSAADSGA